MDEQYSKRAFHSRRISTDGRVAMQGIADPWTWVQIPVRAPKKLFFIYLVEVAIPCRNEVQFQIFQKYLIQS